MRWVDALPFALLAAGSGASLWAYRRDRSSPMVEALLSRLFAAFGIRDVDCWLAAAVWLGTAAVGGLALDFIAHNHLGAGYPWWYGVVTVVTGLGIGLVCARAVVGPGAPDDADQLPDDADASPDDRGDAPSAGDDNTPGDATADEANEKSAPKM